MTAEDIGLQNSGQKAPAGFWESKPTQPKKVDQEEIKRKKKINKDADDLAAKRMEKERKKAEKKMAQQKAKEAAANA